MSLIPKLGLFTIVYTRHVQKRTHIATQKSTSGLVLAFTPNAVDFQILEVEIVALGNYSEVELLLHYKTNNALTFIFYNCLTTYWKQATCLVLA